MSDSFVHYVEPIEVVNDDSRRVDVSVGQIGGLELYYLGSGIDNKRVDLLLKLDELRSLRNVLKGIDPDTNPLEGIGGYYLYRVVITKYPEGALQYFDDGGEEFGYPDPEWRPDGWEPDEEWLDRFGDKFFWPSTKHEYKSQSSARARAKLIESYGATAIVQRSSLITWPAPDGDQA